MATKKVFAIMYFLLIANVFAIYKTLSLFSNVSKSFNWRHYVSLVGTLIILLLTIFLTYKLVNKKE